MSDIQRELALLVTGKDVSASRTLKNTSRQISSLEKHASKAGANIGRNIERGFMIGATAAVAATGYAINAASDFESQLRTINTIARADEAALTGIGDTIRAESRESGTAVEDLTAAYYDLLSAGIKTADAQNVLHTANTLAIGGLSTTTEAVDLLTTAINTYGGDASKGAQFADEFAVAIERGKVTAADLAASYASVGPLAAQLGIENAELAAGYARLTAGGTQAGEATTQMAAALTALIKKSGALKALEKQTGKNYESIAGKKGLAAAYEQLRKDAKKADVPLSDLLGRKEALLYLLQVTGPNFDAYNADLAAVGEGAGTAAEQMGEKQQGLAFQMKRLRANVHDAAITIGTELLPEFADLASEGTAWLQGHQPEIKAFAKDLAKGIRDAVAWARSLDWDAIGNALKAGAGFAAMLVTAFTSAPPWVQQFLAAGFVANKFTGGVIGDVLGEMGKGLIKGVLGMNAGVVHIKAGMVTGAGGVGGGVAGAAGAAGKGLSALSKVFLVGEAIGLALMVEEVRKGIAEQNGEFAGVIQTQTAAFLAAQPDKAALEIALAGVDKGIADLTSNPLNVLVQGDALEKLQQMRTDIAAQLAATNTRGVPGPVKNSRAPANPFARPDRDDAVKAAVNNTTTAVETMRGNMNTKFDTGAASTVAAGLAAKNAVDASALAATTASALERQATLDASVRAVAASQALATAQAVASAGVAAASAAAGMAAAAATARAAATISATIRANRPIVNVSPTTINRTTVVQERTGNNSGSRGQ